MERQIIKTFEYGAAKNGGTVWFLPEINTLLTEWKGDVLLEEWIEILSWQLEEIKIRKVSGAIGDTTNLGPTGEEHDRWVQETYLAKIVKAGLRKLAIVLPNDALGEMAMQELIDNMKNNKTDNNSALQINYVKDVGEAVQWMRSKNNTII
jgi:hypothetical protein